MTSATKMPHEVYWSIIDQVEEHGRHAIEFDTRKQAYSVRGRFYAFFSQLKKSDHPRHTLTDGISIFLENPARLVLVRQAANPDILAMQASLGPTRASTELTMTDKEKTQKLASEMAALGLDSSGRPLQKRSTTSRRK